MESKDSTPGERPGLGFSLPSHRLRLRIEERVAKGLLFMAALVSVLTTVGIVVMGWFVILLLSNIFRLVKRLRSALLVLPGSASKIRRNFDWLLSSLELPITM